MLVLTRKVGHEIIVGENIRIVVISIEPGKVRIGIEAPRDVEIWRRELLDLDDSKKTPPQ